MTMTPASSKRTVTLVYSLLCLFTTCSYAFLEEENKNSDMKAARELAKPWLMRSVTVGGVALFLSPASIITIILVVVNLWSAFRPNPRYAEASHILIQDPSEKNKKMLEEMRKDIKGDYKKFGDFASKYSQCPSKSKRGDLGRFKPGDMAPPFDKAVFDPSSKTATTLGPVQTQFGYHLIFIRQRNI
jgi:peptidyl-prolyl cis-trans isomerase C